MKSVKNKIAPLRGFFGAILPAVLLAVLLGLLPAGASAQKTLRFGLAMPMTGRSALYGMDQVKVARWAVADINKKGGVRGRKLEMVTLDTQANPQLAINVVNRLISVEKVPIFITAWSSVVKAVAPISNRNKVLELSIGAASPAIANLGDYVYTAFPLADVDITALAKYSYRTLGKRRAGVIFINNDSGVDAAKVYRKTFRAAGGKIVIYEGYEPKTTDFTGLILKMKGANPDIVHVHGLVADIPQVIAQMRQLGLKMRVTTYAAGYNPKIIKALGPAAEGLIVTSLAPGVAQNPNVGTYLKRWQREVGRKPNGLPYTQYLHDAPYVVAALFGYLLDKNLPITGPNMRVAIMNVGPIELPLTGRLVFNANHTVNKPVNLLVVKNGKFVPLATVQ